MDEAAELRFVRTGEGRLFSGQVYYHPQGRLVLRGCLHFVSPFTIDNAL